MPLDFENSKEPEPALTTLLGIYSERKDLQEVYPEVSAGNYARLIDWAAGVSGEKWKDTSYTILRPYEPWYSANFTAAPSPLVWSSLQEATATASNPIPTTLEVMRDESSTDISFHLPTLSLLITEFRLKNIVEVGVRSGNSTLALLEAATRIGGRVTSVDTEPCHEAKKRVNQAGFQTIWRFLEADDLEVPDSDLPRSIDLLFVDTDHLYEHTRKELEKYSRFLRTGSWIAFHDYVSFPGVPRAVHEFMTSLSCKAQFYPFLHQNGLALVRLNSPIRRPGWFPSLISKGDRFFNR